MNLIRKGKFYYHPRLQIAPPPPKLKQLDNGDYVEIYQHEEDEYFSLRIVSSFTIEDACQYFHDKMGTLFTNKNRDVAAMLKLLAECGNDVDLVMCTIDCASLSIHDSDQEPPASPIYITDYIKEGKVVLNDRITNCRQYGLDHELVD